MQQKQVDKVVEEYKDIFSSPIQELLEKGHIFPKSSPCGSPIVLVQNT
jgi:hypothetical protein